MELPLDHSPPALADWLELELLTTDRVTLSNSDVQARLSQEPDPTLSPQASQGQEDDHWSALTSDLWRELRHRSHAARTGYPFLVESENIALRDEDWHQWKTYTFLAAVGARLRYRFSVDVNDTARLFEYVVTSALRLYISGSARRVGWPTERHSPGFEERTRQLALELMSEPWGQLTGVSPAVKDHGLDVIAWRSFDDERPGQPILLCQCAIGTDFWEKKVDDQAWRMVIHFTVRPTPAIAFPVIPHLSDPQERSRWVGASISGGLMFDRLRIAAFAGRHCVEDLESAAEFDVWLEDVLPRLAMAQPRGIGTTVAGRAA